MSSYSRQQLEAWLKTIDVSGRVLDIGGSQKPIDPSRTKSWDVVDYKILDLENPHEKKAEPDLVLDLNKESTILEKFDTVFCLEVMEYIYNPVQALWNISRFLKIGGLLYISFHYFYPHHEPKGEDCLRYTRWGVEKLLKESGFEIEEITAKKFTQELALVDVYRNEGMKGIDKNFNTIHYEQGWMVKAKKI